MGQGRLELRDTVLVLTPAERRDLRVLLEHTVRDVARLLPKMSQLQKDDAERTRTTFHSLAVRLGASPGFDVVRPPAAVRKRATVD